MNDNERYEENQGELSQTIILSDGEMKGVLAAIIYYVCLEVEGADKKTKMILQQIGNNLGPDVQNQVAGWLDCAGDIIRGK